jgi:hypothetical protein
MTQTLHTSARLAQAYADLALAEVQHGGYRERLEQAREELMKALAAATRAAPPQR